MVLASASQSSSMKALPDQDLRSPWDLAAPSPIRQGRGQTRHRHPASNQGALNHVAMQAGALG